MPLAPWFHTAGIVVLFGCYAVVSRSTHREITDAPRIPLYISQLLLAWMLLATVVAGLYHRRAFFQRTLLRRTRALWIDPALGVGIYLGTLSLFAILVTGLTVVVSIHDAKIARAASTQATHTSQATSPSPAEAAIQAQQHVQRLMHIDRNGVASIAPRTAPQLLLWVLVSFTAGFCEEHIFRGYLLTQCILYARRTGASRAWAAALSVVATSLLFGSLHLYEGVGGAVMVGILGAVLAVMSLQLGNLRAVIVAHFLQDMIGGLGYYIAHTHHMM